MSDPKSPPSLTDVPAEAKRRGGIDTLFSAPWFDENAPPPGGDASLANVTTEEVGAPKRSTTLALVAVGVVALVVLPILVCGGLGAIGGIYYYLAATGAL
jgi:hypothetical protein